MSRKHREASKKRPQPPPISLEERRPVGHPVTPLIRIDDEGLGPAMAALPPAQRAFVAAKVRLGMSNSDAAEAAGYSAHSPRCLSVVGCRLAAQTRIQSAILEEGQRLMRSEGPRSIMVLVQIRDDKSLAAKDRMKAATELLDRSGFHAMTEHHVSVEHSLSDAEKDRRMLALCAELGLAPAEAQKMLVAPVDQKTIEGAYEEVQDAEFEEVAPDLTEEEKAEQAKLDHENELRRLRRHMTPEELTAHKAKMRKASAERARQRYFDMKAEREGRNGAEGLEDILGTAQEGEVQNG